MRWIHDDAFFNESSAIPGGPDARGLPYPAFSIRGSYIGTDSSFPGYTSSPVDPYGDAFISFNKPVASVVLDGPYDAGFSILAIADDASAAGKPHSVADGGSTLMLLGGGLLGLMGIKMIRKQTI
jgi:hypothetical protein